MKGSYLWNFLRNTNTLFEYQNRHRRGHAYLKGIDALLVNLIHDEIVLEAAHSDGPAARRALQEAMIAGMRSVFPRAETRGLVEAAQGPSWAEAK